VKSGMHSGAEGLAIPDFDGTLVPVLADLTEEWLDASTCYVLARLSRTSDTCSSLLADAPSTIFACVVCVPDIIYAGNRHVLGIRDDYFRTAVLYTEHGGLRSARCVYFRDSKTDEDSLVAVSGSMTHKVEKDSGSQAKKNADGPPDVREVVQ
jgi:trehalose-6-phosphatase